MDNTLILVRGKVKEAKEVKNLLMWFTVVSGLKVSTEKKLLCTRSTWLRNGNPFQICGIAGWVTFPTFIWGFHWEPSTGALHLGPTVKIDSRVNWPCGKMLFID